MTYQTESRRKVLEDAEEGLKEALFLHNTRNDFLSRYKPFTQEIMKRSKKAQKKLEKEKPVLLNEESKQSEEEKPRKRLSKE